MTTQEIEALSGQMIDALGKVAAEHMAEGNIDAAIRLNTIMMESDTVTLAKLAQIIKGA